MTFCYPHILSTLVPLAGIYVAASPIVGDLTARGSAQYTIPSGYLTTFYDGLFHKNGNRCGQQYASESPAPKWPIKDQAMWTLCQTKVSAETAPWLWALQTDRIVAIDRELIKADGGIEKWCGKEVRITKPDGEVFEFSEGPLFVWDGCGSCGNKGIDLSVPAFLDATGLPDQQCGNVSGFKIEVLNKNIWDAPNSYDWQPANGAGEAWDKYDLVAGNSWTKAQQAYDMGEALTLPNGEKVEAAPSPQTPSGGGEVNDTPPTDDITTVAQPSAQESGGSGQTTSSITVTPGNGVGAGCEEKGLRSCSKDRKWLLMCNYFENGKGLTWEQANSCPAGCAVSAEGTLEACA